MSGLPAVLVGLLIGGGIVTSPALAQEVTTKSDHARARLEESLQAKVDSGSTATVPVFVTLSGDPAAVQQLLSDDHTATSRGASIVLGRIPVQAATNRLRAPGRRTPLGPASVRR
jgi:hypothetical protein